MRSIPYLLLGLLCGALWGQDPPVPPKVYRVGNDVLAPRILQKSDPGYTDEARIAKLAGSVLLSLVIDEQGVPRDIRVIKSVGLGLDESAVSTVSQWRFAPGTRDNQPVRVASTIETTFRLLIDSRMWHLSRASFQVAADMTKPRVQSAPYAAPSGPEQEATARVAFDIDPQGVPLNAQIENSSDPVFNNDVLTMIQAWRFQPATKGGAPVQSHAIFDFSRGDATVRRQ